MPRAGDDSSDDLMPVLCQGGDEDADVYACGGEGAVVPAAVVPAAVVPAAVVPAAVVPAAVVPAAVVPAAVVPAAVVPAAVVPAAVVPAAVVPAAPRHKKRHREGVISLCFALLCFAFE
jgi:hypothetical protein